MTKRDNEIERLVKERKLRVVLLSTIHTDPSYQRDVKAKHRKIIAEFDEDSLGVPLIGERSDGSLWIVDGLQRITAVRKLGWTEIRADVFRSDGPVHEAQVFKRVNLDRTAIKPMEQFKARLVAQDEAALNIVTAVEEEGFKVSKQGVHKNWDDEASRKCVGAVNTLVQIYTKYGTDHIRFALRVAATCWPGDRLAVNSQTLMALAIFYEAVEQAPDWDRLIPRFRSVSVQRILYAANQACLSGGSGNDFACADQLMRLYRKRMRRI